MEGQAFANFLDENFTLGSFSVKMAPKNKLKKNSFFFNLFFGAIFAEMPFANRAARAAQKAKPVAAEK
jgi:hypothetical protein